MKRAIFPILALVFVSHAAMADDDLIKGEQVYKKCMACHAIADKATKVGPSLLGVFGRKVASFEGYNYFGAGLILLLPIALVLFWRDLVAFPKRYPALFLVLTGLFLYAISNHVWLGPYELFSFPLPTWITWLTGSFRAAGRFFWLMGYLILVATLVAFCKKK